MPTTIAHPEIDTHPKGKRGGGGFNGGGRDDDSGRWGAFGADPTQTSPDAYRLATWLGLASITMLFAALSSAYVFRMGASPDWRSISLPAFLLPNSGLLLASSMTLECFRRALRKGLTAAAQIWIAVTTLLGAGFLVGQIWIWKALAAQGIYLSSNGHSSFFYLMTGAHGVHLVGGLMALLVLSWKACRQVYPTRGLRIITDVTTIYWHFMDGLWIYLFLLLFLWR